MNDEQLSLAIAAQVNGLCQQYGEGEPVRMMNCMANITSFCINSLLINIGAERTLDMICRMHREAEVKEFMREIEEPGHDTH